MPKDAARIWLKVTDVRVERLQEITEDQTEEEGFLFTPHCLHLTGENYCDIDGPCTSKIKYCDMGAGELFGKVLWNSTIKKTDIDRYGWDANPYVWVIEFERCEKPGKEWEMNIDEAIKRHKAMATKGNVIFSNNPDLAEKHNKEHEQIVEWLEELKWYWSMLKRCRSFTLFVEKQNQPIKKV